MIYKMKLWQKIFIISLITNIFLFAFCGIFVVVSGHKLNLDNERSYLLNTHDKIENCITAIKNVENGSAIHIDELTNIIRDNIAFESVSLNFYINDKLFLDTLNKKIETPKYDLYALQNRGDIYVDVIQGRHYYFAEKSFEINSGLLRLVVIKDIESVYSRCNKQLEILFYLCAILSVIAAFIMLATSYIITKPIKRINEAVNFVTQNNYSYRLPVNNMDELNELSENFNIMSSAVERNIVNYKSAISNFTHEVKTPLTSILGYADIISNSSYSEDTKKEAAEYILAESKRLNSLVNKIINFLTIGLDSIEQKIVFLSDLIDMSCLTVKLQAEMKNVTITVTRCENVYLYGDEELLVVLLVNLLDNAIKASNSGSKIDITFKHKNYALVSISITDYGLGIPEEDLVNITDVFYTVDKSRCRSQNGLGLGLAICSEIIKSHNAKLTIKSKVQRGTTVTVDFPYGTYLNFKYY